MERLTDWLANCLDEIVTNRHKSRADADYYSLERQAQANRLLLTPEYLELKRYESIAANAKLYFGSSIPSFFVGTDAKADTQQIPAVLKDDKS